METRTNFQKFKDNVRDLLVRIKIRLKNAFSKVKNFFVAQKEKLFGKKEEKAS